MVYVVQGADEIVTDNHARESVSQAGSVASDLSSALRDPARLRALRQLAILDTGAEQAFDRLTVLVTKFLRVPMSLVSLIDENRQFFKSSVGLPESWASTRETSLSYSFCQHAIHLRQPLIITDARDHPLVRDNPAVPALGVVAYAGVPLITSDGHALGTLCAIDRAEREWNDEEIATLADLAASVVAELELRAAVRESALRADRLERLQSLTSALSGALSVDAVADAVLQGSLAALGAVAGTVALLTDDDENLEIVCIQGYAEEYVEPYRRFSIDLPVPLADAVRQEEPIFLESSDMWDQYYPGVAIHLATGGEAAAALPLVTGNGVLGGVSLTFAERREFLSEEREYMLTIARQGAQALERARFYTTTFAAQSEVEEERERIEFILDAMTAVAREADERTAFQALANLIVASLADGCVIDGLQNGAIRRLAVAFADQDSQGMAGELLYHFAPSVESKHPVARVIRTARPAYGRVDQNLALVTSGDEAHHAVIDALGLTSFLCVPLISSDRPFGALSMLSCSERHMFDERDVAFAQELARRAAMLVGVGRLQSVSDQ